MPEALTLRTLGGGFGEPGEDKYMINRYLRERGDANIKTNADLIAKATFYNDPNFPNRRAAREQAERATALDTSARMHTRFALQTLLMHCMEEQKLDALVAPMSTVPPRKLLSPREPASNGRTPIGWFMFGQQGFPVIDVPAGFTTAVWDRERVGNETRLVGPIRGEAARRRRLHRPAVRRADAVPHCRRLRGGDEEPPAAGRLWAAAMNRRRERPPTKATSASWPPPAIADSRGAPLAVRAQEEEHRELALLDRFLDPVRHPIDVPGHEVEHGRTDRIDVPLFRGQVLAQQHLGAVRLSIPCQYGREQADHRLEPWRKRKAPLGQPACLVHLAVRGQIDAKHEVGKEKRLVELENLAQLLVPLGILATPIAGTRHVPPEP